jgi:hypothetical protein
MSFLIHDDDDQSAALSRQSSATVGHRHVETHRHSLTPTTEPDRRTSRMASGDIEVSMSPTKPAYADRSFRHAVSNTQCRLRTAGPSTAPSPSGIAKLSENLTVGSRSCRPLAAALGLLGRVTTGSSRLPAIRPRIATMKALGPTWRQFRSVGEIYWTSKSSFSSGPSLGRNTARATS